MTPEQLKDSRYHVASLRKKWQQRVRETEAWLREHPNGGTYEYTVKIEKRHELVTEKQQHRDLVSVFMTAGGCFCLIMLLLIVWAKWYVAHYG